MSYYVYITRKPNPHEERGDKIPKADWQSLVFGDPSFRPPTEGENAQVAPCNSPGDLIWNGHPSGSPVWFTWSDGQIYVRNPDEIMIALMARLAAQLNADLIGEDGERFDSAGISKGIEELPWEN